MRKGSSAAWAMSFGWIINSALPRDLRQRTRWAWRISSLSAGPSAGPEAGSESDEMSTGWTAHVVMSVATSSGQMAIVLMFLFFSSCAQ